MFILEWPSRDSPGLNTLEHPAIRHAAVDFVEEAAQRERAHLDFDDTVALERPLDRHQLGALGALRPETCVPFTAIDDDVRNVGQGLRIVGNGWTFPEPFFHGARWLGSWLPAHAHD